jgi:prophage antirepressor-like protein
MKTLEKAFNGKQVRVIIQRGVEWFVTKDVCGILGLGNVSEALSGFPDQEIANISIGDLRKSGIEAGNRGLTAINEPGLYRLIFKSRKPEAEAFKTWVFGEVLPSIRRTGKYDVRDVRAKSVENRNAITAGWKRQGLSRSREYAGATRHEYQTLYGDTSLRKAEMSRDQILALSALEAVEALKYSRLPADTLKLPGVKQSIGDTAALLETATRPALRSA